MNTAPLTYFELGFCTFCHVERVPSWFEWLRGGGRRRSARGRLGRGRPDRRSSGSECALSSSRPAQVTRVLLVRSSSWQGQHRAPRTPSTFPPLVPACPRSPRGAFSLTLAEYNSPPNPQSEQKLGRNAESSRAGDWRSKRRPAAGEAGTERSDVFRGRRAPRLPLRKVDWRVVGPGSLVEGQEELAPIRLLTSNVVPLSFSLSTAT